MSSLLLIITVEYSVSLSLLSLESVDRGRVSLLESELVTGFTTSVSLALVESVRFIVGGILGSISISLAEADSLMAIVEITLGDSSSISPV